MKFFEKFKTILYKVFLMVLFFVFAKSCVSDYVKGGDKEKIEQYRKMIADNSYVIADLSNEYTKTKISYAVVLYKFDYSFELDGNLYTGKISLNELPSERRLRLFYLIENPNIVANDPFEDIKNEESKGKINDLIFGILFGILGVILLLSLINNVFKLKKTKNNIQKIDKPKVKLDQKETTKRNENQIVELSEEEKLKILQEKEKRRMEKEDHSRFMPK